MGIDHSADAPAVATTPYALTGGGQSLLTLVDRFYELMDQVGIPESLATKLRESFYATADWMRNRDG